MHLTDSWKTLPVCSRATVDLNKQLKHDLKVFFLGTSFADMRFQESVSGTRTMLHVFTQKHTTIGLKLVLGT